MTDDDTMSLADQRAAHVEQEDERLALVDPGPQEVDVPRPDRAGKSRLLA